MNVADRGRAAAREHQVPLAELAAVAALTAAAGLAWSSTFSGGLLVPGILGAAALHPAVAASTSASNLLRRRGRRVAVGLEAAAVLLAVAVGGASAAIGSLQRGWGDLLTTSLPVDAGAQPFGLALVTTWAAGLAATELVLARGRALAPVLPPLVAMIVALAVGAPGPAVPLAVPGAVIVAAGVLVAIRAATRASAEDERLAEEAGLLAGPALARLPGVERVPPPRSRSPLLPLAAGGAVAAAVALLAVAVGPALPGVGSRPRFDVRRYRSDPVVEREAPNPLVDYSSLIRTPDRPVALVRNGSADTRVRTATLDSFDGSTWTSTARFTRASTLLPAEPGLNVPTDQLTIDVEVEDLPGPYLPAPDRPIRVDEDGLGIDVTTGVLVAPDGKAGGRRYRVTSAVPRRTALDLRGATQTRRSGEGPPHLPDDLRRQAEAITAEAASSFGKPAALLRHFEDPAQGFTTATKDLPGGHGYFALRKLFERRTGTDEQYASAIAVLSRALGYESRVAVGFLLPAPGPDGVARVQGRHAHAWAEVRFEGLGWVPLAPSPTSGASGAAPTTPSTLPQGAGPSAPRTVPPDPVQAAAQAAPTDPTAPAVPVQHGGRGGAVGVAAKVGLVAAAAVVMALLVVIALVGVKAVRRRRRRRATDPKAAVLGAWADALDGLAEHGGQVWRSMSAGEVVAAANPAAAPSLSGLAHLANAARFDQVGSSPEHAASAWAAADAVRSALRTTASLPGRVRAAISPAPLLRRT